MVHYDYSFDTAGHAPGDLSLIYPLIFYYYPPAGSYDAQLKLQQALRNKTHRCMNHSTTMGC